MSGLVGSVSGGAQREDARAGGRRASVAVCSRAHLLLLRPRRLLRRQVQEERLHGWCGRTRGDWRVAESARWWREGATGGSLGVKEVGRGRMSRVRKCCVAAAVVVERERERRELGESMAMKGGVCERGRRGGGWSERERADARARKPLRFPATRSSAASPRAWRPNSHALRRTLSRPQNLRLAPSIGEGPSLLVPVLLAPLSTARARQHLERLSHQLSLSSSSVRRPRSAHGALVLTARSGS